MAGAENSSLRLDKWLWYARLFKTRGLASAAVRGGHVKLNGERPKPGAQLKVGDALTVVKAQQRYELTVARLPERRGPAVEAASCYAEDEMAKQARLEHVAGLRSDRLHMATTRGRPDKHTRRALRARNRERDS